MDHPYHGGDGADDASSLGSKSFHSNADDRSAAASGPALPRVFDAGAELESLCRAEMSGGTDPSVLGFPRTCLPIVRLLPGNHCCVDCGDERRDRLNYASVGYGTVLCQDCAHRHVTMSEKESNVKSLRDEHWTLRSVLSILEGSNTKMLDYVKHKPRWRPPRGSKGDITGDDSEDVLAFKSIYLSKAAGSYRAEMAKRVDDVFYGRLTAMREEDAKREEMMENMNVVGGDPFRHIFEQNDVSPDDIPGFGNGLNESSHLMAAKRGSETSNSKSPAAKARGGRKGRSNMSAPLAKHESPSMDLIRERINARRSMNPTIAASQQAMAAMAGENGGSLDNSLERTPSLTKLEAGTPTSSPPAATKPLAPYVPASRRRASDQGKAGLVGEVGGTEIQEQYDDQYAAVMARDADGPRRRKSFEKRWSNPDLPDDDDGSIVRDGRGVDLSYASRSKAAPLGMYRRVSNEGGQATVGQQQRRPMYRPPKS